MFALTIRELAETIGGRLSLGSMPPLGGDLDPVGRIATDSRQVQAGELFWGLKGRRSDGSRFAEEAFLRGAKGVVVSGRHVEPWAGTFSIEVEDSAWALWQLARSARQAFDGRILAAAGELATATKAVMHAVLSRKFRGRASCSSDGPGPWDGALDLLGLEEDDDYGIIELDASGSDHVDAMAHLCCPHFAVISGTAPETGGPQTQAAQMEAYRELLTSLPDDGCAILNGDDPKLRRLGRDYEGRVLWFGRDADCDVLASHVRSSEGSLSFAVDGQVVRLPVWGRHCLSAALAAWSVGRLLQVSPSDMADALSQFKPLPGRCLVQQAGGVTWIDNTGGQHDAAIRSALELLAEIDIDGRRIVVYSEASNSSCNISCHRQLGEATISTSGADVVLADGPHARQIVQSAHGAGLPRALGVVCRNQEETIANLLAIMEPGDAVLLVGGETALVDELVSQLELKRQVTAA